MKQSRKYAGKRPVLTCRCGAKAPDTSRHRKRFQRRHTNIPDDVHDEYVRIQRIRKHGKAGDEKDKA